MPTSHNQICGSFGLDHLNANITTNWTNIVKLHNLVISDSFAIISILFEVYYVMQSSFHTTEKEKWGKTVACWNRIAWFVLIAN